MEISLNTFTSIFNSVSDAERAGSPPQFDNHNFFANHKAIFEHYGINHNTIDPTKVTVIETIDGPFCVFGPQCVICPPPEYYTRPLRARLADAKNSI